MDLNDLKEAVIKGDMENTQALVTAGLDQGKEYGIG